MYGLTDGCCKASSVLERTGDGQNVSVTVFTPVYPLLILPGYLIMSYTRANLVAKLNEHGEDPPASWTVLQLKSRLSECLQAVKSGDVKTLEGELDRLNRAAKKKPALIAFLKDYIEDVPEKKTIPQLHALGSELITAKFPPRGSEKLGFGKFGYKTFLEVYNLHKDYCNWIRKTASEGDSCHWRLSRFASWLQEVELGTLESDPELMEDKMEKLGADPKDRRQQGRVSFPARESKLSAPKGRDSKSSASSTKPVPTSIYDEKDELAEALDRIKELEAQKLQLESQMKEHDPRGGKNRDPEPEVPPSNDDDVALAGEPVISDEERQRILKLVKHIHSVSGRLIKAAPEQLRAATDRERAIEELKGDLPDDMQWEEAAQQPVEVHERHLSPEERAQFREAKMKEGELLEEDYWIRPVPEIYEQMNVEPGELLKLKRAAYGSSFLKFRKSTCPETGELRVHAFPNSPELALVGWADAAWANRPDGKSSTEGIVIGFSSPELREGKIAPVSLAHWRTIVTDSKNLWDKLSKEILVIKGAEKRSDLEAIALKESQINSRLQLRWVHSDAMLANSLTKPTEKWQIQLFLKMKQHWRIVHDSSMTSARRRKAEGIDPMHSEAQR
ncbi:unnamed protein product [Symbiodinium pilosum]|uniref:Uncharacterized protein n=1 Tax=Symbiodinium pilosum TaxID=2952 RepID=A0A812PLF7_SYMPI|nr:unnamed protein product [Symbiodinium pilosum]